MATRDFFDIQSPNTAVKILAFEFTPFTGSLVNPAGSPGMMPQYYAALGLSGSTCLIPSLSTSVSGSGQPIVRVGGVGGTGSFMCTLRNPYAKVLGAFAEYRYAAGANSSIWAGVSGSGVGSLSLPRGTLLNSVTGSFITIQLLQGSGSNTVAAGSATDVNGQPGDRVSVMLLVKNSK